MATQKRQRELERRHYERQQAKRSQQYSHRRQRQQATAAVLTVLAVIAGFIVLAVLVRDPNPVVSSEQASEQPTPTTETAPQPPATEVAASTGPDGQITCSYHPGEASVKPLQGLPPATAPALAGTVTTTLTVNKQAVRAQLSPAQAPCTVRSFVFLAQQHFFDNTTCHRITKGGQQPNGQQPNGNKGLSVVQCGDPSASGSGGPGYSMGTENLPQPTSAEQTSGEVTYPAGTLAMGNSGSPNSTGSQFFLVYADSTLGPNYTVFGKITSGLEHVSVLAKTLPANSDGRPKTPINLNSVTISGA